MTTWLVKCRMCEPGKCVRQTLSTIHFGLIHFKLPLSEEWLAPSERLCLGHRTANVNEYSTRYSEAIDSAQSAEIPNGAPKRSPVARAARRLSITRWVNGYRCERLSYMHYPIKCMLRD